MNHSRQTEEKPGTSIGGILKSSYGAIIFVMICPVIILLLTMLMLTARYDRLIENIDQASRMRSMVQSELPEEIWNIVSGKQLFHESGHAKSMTDLGRGLERLEGHTNNAQQYIESARRANHTLQGYIDSLKAQVQSGDSVSYSFKAYRDINSVAGLISSVLEQYINEEIVSIAFLNRNMQKISIIVALLSGFVVAVIVVLSTGFFGRLREAIHGPIRNLEEMTARIAAGDLSVRMDDCRVEELANLTGSLNVMAGRLSDLIDERIGIQDNLKRAEMRALQEQITPHFVYNTFETIVWLAESEQYEQVVDICMAFTDFFRISVSGGKDFITVEREEQHIRSYLIIQSVRYGNMMSYTVEIDAEIHNERILKLLLQPLVENAIYHGIQLRRTPGHIKVRGARHKGGCMIFSVEDDGMGMDEVTLHRVQAQLDLLELPQGDDDGGFGLYNVNRRIRLYYGGEGLHIDSKTGKGTRVYFCIPCGEGGT